MAEEVKHALGEQVHFEAGSQLIAHFKHDLDAADLLENTEGLLMDALASVSGVRTEVARGCSTVVYITFITFKEAPQAAVMKLLDELLKQGATLMRIPGLEDQSGILRLQTEGLPYVPPLRIQGFK